MQRHIKGPVARAITGFSLFQLLVAIAVAGIALAIAIPSFTSVITANQLSATANELIGALNQARMAAIKRNLPTQFCSDMAINNGTDALAAACGPSVAAVFVSGDTNPIVAGPQVPENISIVNITALRFAGNGLASSATGSGAYSGLVADVYTTKVASNNHRCIYLITGSVISSCKITAGSGGCPVNEPSSCQQQ